MKQKTSGISFDKCPNFGNCSTEKNSQDKQPKKASQVLKPRPKSKTEIQIEKLDAKLDRMESTLNRVESKVDNAPNKTLTKMIDLINGYSQRYTKINIVRNYLHNCRRSKYRPNTKLTYHHKINYI